MPEQPQHDAATTRRIRIEIGVSVVLAVLAIGYVVIDVWRTTRGNGWEGFDRLVVGIQALGTLAIFSILYRENPVSRFFEHLLVGVSVGYGVGVGWTNIFYPNFVGPLSGQEGQPVNLWWLLCVIPGLMWYFQLSKTKHWISKLVICTFMGMGCGMAFKGVFNILLGDRGQITQAIQPVFGVFADRVPPGGVWADVSGLLMLVISLCVLSYFFFSFRHERNPLLRVSSRAGRYFLMVCFGAVFGTTVQGRMSLLIDRLSFLFNDWLQF